MRVLLDEHLPVDLALGLAGHDVDTVVGRGWAGIKNGDLLRRMSGDYDVLITMDGSGAGRCQRRADPSHADRQRGGASGLHGRQRRVPRHDQP